MTSSAESNTLSIAQLRQRVQRKTSNVYDTLYTRRASVYLTYVLARFPGVRPNHVTVFAFLVAATATAMVGFGTGTVALVGALLIHAYAVLDSVDGELARLRKDFSLKGLYLEDLSAYFLINGFNLATAAYVYRTQGDAVALWVAIAFAAFGRNAMPVARRALIKSVMTRRPVEPGIADRPAAPPHSSRLREFARWAIRENVLHSMTIWVEMSLAITAEQVFGLQRWGVARFVFYVLMVGQVAKELAAYVQVLRGHNLEIELSRIYDAARMAPHDRRNVDGIDLASE